MFKDSDNVILYPINSLFQNNIKHKIYKHIRLIMWINYQIIAILIKQSYSLSYLKILNTKNYF